MRAPPAFLLSTSLHKGLRGGDAEMVDSIGRGCSGLHGRAGFQKASFPHFYIPRDGRGWKNTSVTTVIEKRNVLSYLRLMPRGGIPVTLVVSTRVDPTPTFCVWDLFSHRGPSTHTQNLCIICALGFLKCQGKEISKHTWSSCFCLHEEMWLGCGFFISDV